MLLRLAHSCSNDDMLCCSKGAVWAVVRGSQAGDLAALISLQGWILKMQGTANENWYKGCCHDASLAFIAVSWAAVKLQSKHQPPAASPASRAREGGTHQSSGTIKGTSWRLVWQVADFFMSMHKPLTGNKARRPPMTVARQRAPARSWRTTSQWWQRSATGKPMSAGHRKP